MLFGRNSFSLVFLNVSHYFIVGPEEGGRLDSAGASSPSGGSVTSEDSGQSTLDLDCAGVIYFLGMCYFLREVVVDFFWLASRFAPLLISLAGNKPVILL